MRVYEDIIKDFLKNVKSSYYVVDDDYTDYVNDELRKAFIEASKLNIINSAELIETTMNKLQEGKIIIFNSEEFLSIEVGIKCVEYKGLVRKQISKLINLAEDAQDKQDVIGHDGFEAITQFASAAFRMTDEIYEGNVRILNDGDYINLPCGDGIYLEYNVSSNEFSISYPKPGDATNLKTKLSENISNIAIEYSAGMSPLTSVKFKKDSSNMRPLLQCLLRENLIYFQDSESFKNAVNEYSKGIGM